MRLSVPSAPNAAPFVHRLASMRGRWFSPHETVPSGFAACATCHGVPGVDRGGNVKNLGYSETNKIAKLKDIRGECYLWDVKDESVIQPFVEAKLGYYKPGQASDLIPMPQTMAEREKEARQEECSGESEVCGHK